MSYWREALGLPPLINAAGKMTYLGASTLDASVAAAMGRAGAEYVDMVQLHRAAGRRVAQWAGAEDAVITSCAAAGIVTAVAACLTGPDMGRARLLPDTSRFARRRVVLQKGHAIDFGMEIVQAVRLTGAVAVEVGSVKRCDPSQMAIALEEPAAAVLYVVSHHAEQDGMLSLEQVVEIASQRSVPVVVDAAAEMDLNRYIAAGASLVVYSGQKAFGGPTSGVVLGRADLVEACRIQEKGIARPMKVSKEAIAGLLRALEQYAATEPVDLVRQLEARAASLADRLQSVLEAVGATRYARISLQEDATRPIPRVALDLDAASGAVTAAQLVAELEGGSPSIRTRNHQVGSGRILFDVRTLREDQLEVIARRVGECLTSGGIHHDG